MKKTRKQAEKEMEREMEESEIYQWAESVVTPLMREIDEIDKKLSKKYGRSVVEYTKWRVKSPHSIAMKLERKHREISFSCAKETLNDLLGVRVICSLYADCFHLTKEIEKIKGLKVRKVKDYITHPKSSGYRSIHIIVDVPFGGETLGMEIQVRSAAMNYWAILDHQLSYKNEKASQKSAEKIRRELRRCAVDIRNIDIRMQELGNRIEKL